MERLSAAEVVRRLRGDFIATAAADLVEQHLTPQWQAEPTGDGWYWVEGCQGPRYVVTRFDMWWRSESVDGVRITLNRRRVCPISGPPPDDEAAS